MVRRGLAGWWRSPWKTSRFRTCSSPRGRARPGITMLATKRSSRGDRCGTPTRTGLARRLRVRRSSKSSSSPFTKIYNLHLVTKTNPDLGRFSTNWKAVISAVVTAAVNPIDPLMLRTDYSFDSIVTSSFSNGWLAHSSFHGRGAGVSGATIRMFDLDGGAPAAGGLLCALPRMVPVLTIGRRRRGRTGSGPKGQIYGLLEAGGDILKNLCPARGCLLRIGIAVSTSSSQGCPTIAVRIRVTGARRQDRTSPMLMNKCQSRWRSCVPCEACRSRFHQAALFPGFRDLDRGRGQLARMGLRKRRPRSVAASRHRLPRPAIQKRQRWPRRRNPPPISFGRARCKTSICPRMGRGCSRRVR